MIEGAYAAGLRVLDLGHGSPPPYCAMRLAMHGTQVVNRGPSGGNRGKKGAAVELRAPAGRDVALTLAERADIVIEGFRPGVAARLGLGDEALAARNARLIYVSVSGFGQEEPHVGLPFADSGAQADLAALNVGNDGGPHRVGIVDALTGVYAAQAVGVALYECKRRGAGARVELGLTQSAAAILGHILAGYVLESGEPQVVDMPTGGHRAKDGWMMIALPRGADFERLVTALGAPEPRFNSCAGSEVRREADILFDRINGLDDWPADPHIVATGVAVETADLPAFKVAAHAGISVAADGALSPAPHIGRRGRAILVGLGSDRAAIARLAAENVVASP